MNFIFVGIGGFFGAISRYGVYLLSSRVLPAGFPYATLIVNTIGSFLLGFLFAHAACGTAHEKFTLMISIGFLGAFTTFSTFSMDLIILYKSGHYIHCLLNLIINPLFSVTAAVLGLKTFA